MSNRNLITINACIIVLIVISLLIFRKKEVLNWFNSQFLKITYAAVLAILAAFIIENIYRKYSHKSKFSKNTKLMKPNELHGILTLPNGEQLTITQDDKIFGREDFLGIIISEKLLFIGKEHFKLSLKDERLYIEDLNTKNGTQVNNEEIKGEGKVKLKDGDQISVAKIFNILYKQKHS
jgi:FHA domain